MPAIGVEKVEKISQILEIFSAASELENAMSQFAMASS